MLTRRHFLKSTALTGAALLVGFRLDDRHAAAADDVLAPNAFVRIAPDNTVTIIGKHLEMGKGSYTGLATILAEELDADWSQIRLEPAPALAQVTLKDPKDFKLVGKRLPRLDGKAKTDGSVPRGLPVPGGLPSENGPYVAYARRT